MRDPVGVKKERMWRCKAQLVSKRNIYEGTRPSSCQKGTCVKMQYPVGVKMERMWRCNTQFVSKTKIGEDAGPSWCQKGTYVKMQDPVGVKKEHMWRCKTQLVTKKERVCVIILSPPYPFILTFPFEAALRERKLKRRGLWEFCSPRHSSFLGSR